MQYPSSTATSAIRKLARNAKIAKPWTFGFTDDGGVLIISQPRGYEPRDFFFTKEEVLAVEPHPHH